tara:strand:- start:2228 stop:3097 length:870 start_codon:yes stop_codon:yes gene_type:complete
VSYLIKSILASLLVLLALPSLAEPSYYTWVDANGIIHNTVVAEEVEATEDTARSKENLSEQNSSSDDAVVPNASNVPEEYKDYKTEGELQQQINSSEDKPFYTWTDGTGRIRNDPKPDMLVEFSAAEIVYDAVFAPPFRLPDQITKGVCCIDYKNAFTQVLSFDSAVSQKISSDSVFYKTRKGSVPAGYFVTNFSADGIENSIVFIKSFKLSAEATFEVVALNPQFQPIYLASNLSGLFIEQTWKDLSYTKVMIELSDPEIEYLIIFANDKDIDSKGYSLSLSLGKAND